MTTTIRPFRHTDLDALIGIAEVSFAEEFTARGSSPDSFANEIRFATQGRMIPLKLLMALAGNKWAMFVAEVDGRVVGCGGYMGHQKMELANLMVHPDYRRRGIGQALLEKRLEQLTLEGFPLVTTTILASNLASLGNVTKQGFEIFDRYSFWESSLPLKFDGWSSSRPLTSRPVLSQDLQLFKNLEEQVLSSTWLQIQGSTAPNYFVPLGERLLSRFMGTQWWNQIFIQGEEVVGFLSAVTAKTQTKGKLNRPIVVGEHLDYLPLMLDKAATWLTQLGKKTLQLAVPDERAYLVTQLEQNGWVKSQSWLRLVKRLK